MCYSIYLDSTQEVIIEKDLNQQNPPNTTEGRLRGDIVLVLPPAALEAGGRRPQPPALHLGGNLQAHTIPAREGTPLLPIPEVRSH